MSFIPHADGLTRPRAQHVGDTGVSQQIGAQLVARPITRWGTLPDLLSAAC